MSETYNPIPVFGTESKISVNANPGQSGRNAAITPAALSSSGASSSPIGVGTSSAFDIPIFPPSVDIISIVSSVTNSVGADLEEILNRLERLEENFDELESRLDEIDARLDGATITCTGDSVELEI